MKALGKYGVASLVVVLIVGAVAWPFLEEAGRLSLLLAVAVTWPFQLGAFALLDRAVGDPSRFMVWWGMGLLGRMAVMAVVGLGLVRLEGTESSVMIVATAGLFFILLLLEPAFFTRPDTERFAR